MKLNNKQKRNVATEVKQAFNIITNDNTGFTVRESDSENIVESLQTSAVAKLAGTFEAKTAGNRTLTATFNYAEGAAVTTTTTTTVIAVELTAILEQMLPASIALNATQEVIFLVSNTSGLDATDITIKDVNDSLGTIQLFKEDDDGSGKYTATAKWTEVDMAIFNAKDASERTLDHNQRFRITATLKTNTAGEKNIELLVTYDEAKHLDDKNKKTGAKVEYATKVVGITVEGTVSKTLLNNIKLGSTHELVFSFTNNSKEHAATGIKIVIDQQETPVSP